MAFEDFKPKYYTAQDVLTDDTLTACEKTIEQVKHHAMALFGLATDVGEFYKQADDIRFALARQRGEIIKLRKQLWAERQAKNKLIDLLQTVDDGESADGKITLEKALSVIKHLRQLLDDRKASYLRNLENVKAKAQEVIKELRAENKKLKNAKPSSKQQDETIAKLRKKYVNALSCKKYAQNRVEKLLQEIADLKLAIKELTENG